MFFVFLKKCKKNVLKISVCRLTNKLFVVLTKLVAWTIMLVFKLLASFRFHQVRSVRTKPFVSVKRNTRGFLFDVKFGFFKLSNQRGRGYYGNLKSSVELTAGISFLPIQVGTAQHYYESVVGII